MRILIILFPIYGFCQSQYRFGHFTIKDGLPQNTVHCSYKDSEGYYWFGTQDGLCRYDGYSVKIFRHDRDDSATISDNFILTMVEDKHRNLWIGTRNRINCFDRRTERFMNLVINEKSKNDNHNDIWFTAPDKDGNIIFRNRYWEIVKVVVDENKAEIIGSGNVMQAISADIYCREHNDSIFFYSAHQQEELMAVHISDSSLLRITSLCRKKTGEIIAGTLHGLFLITKNKPAQAIYPELKDAMVTCMLYDSKNNLWVGTATGLYIIREDRKPSIALLKHVSEDPESLSGNSVQSIYEDHDGLVWIGTAEGGVNIYDPRKEVFRIFHYATSIKLPANPVYGIFADKNELWLGTGSGMSHFIMENENISGLYSGENKILVSEILKGSGNRSDSIGSNFIVTIAKDKNGNLWFGSQDNGIAIYARKEKKWRHLNKGNSCMGTNSIFHIMCTSNGDMWISTSHGRYRYPFPYEKSYAPGQLSFSGHGYTFSIYEDKRGNIWVGTTSGVIRLTMDGEKYAEYISDAFDKTSVSYNMATSFFEDSKGNFWVATLGGGLNLMDREKGTFRAFTKNDGLPNDVIYCMLEDKSGKIWFSTNAGLSCFDPEKKLFNNYSEKDGIVSKEFIQNSAFRTADGELLFGSPDGMIAFHPEKINFPDKEIPLVLTSLKINYEPRNYLPGEDLKLFYDDKTVSFEFAAPDFRNQHKVFYSFRLEGFDNDWHDVTSDNRIASYTNLPFGVYTFKVRARTGKNNWQQRQLEIRTSVIPPFWLRPWFILLEVFAVMIIIIFLVKYYSQRKLRKKLREIELRQKIHLERERISRDLHDNVGSNLTYITTALDQISYKMTKGEKELSQDKISSLSDFTRSTMQQLRETIWAINKESVMLSEFKDKVSEHLSKMLSNENNMNFSVRFNGDDLRLRPSDAIHLFRIVQESVNNCIKHSEAKNISFEISGSKNKDIRITVYDDGKGFDKNLDMNGHYGLENMQARVSEMGGRFELNTEPGKGTGITILLPL